MTDFCTEQEGEVTHGAVEDYGAGRRLRPNNITKCETVVGAITLDILAINDENQDKDYSNVPALMDGWTNTGAAGTVAAWEAFKAHFNLPSEYLGKTIYFRPNCDGQYAGVTGGKFFGVFARIPVLVQ